MFALPVSKQDPIVITVNVDDCALPMELDTGVSLSVISEKVYKTLHQAPNCSQPQHSSEHTKVNLLMYWVVYQLMYATMPKKSVYPY